MILPIIACEGAVCFAGIGWRPEQLAAFLAWWMPFNLLSFLALLAWASVTISSKWQPNAFSLKQFAVMTMAFWPMLLSRATHVLVLRGLHRRSRKRRMANQQAYFNGKDYK